MMRFLILAMLSLLMLACSKDPGEGGNSTITGKVFVRDFDSEGNLRGEYYAPKEDVFIIYGDENFYGDFQDTHYDGSFKFEYLYKGKYKIYAYSKCRTCPSGVEPIFLETEITESDQTITLPDLVIED